MSDEFFHLMAMKCEDQRSRLPLEYERLENGVQVLEAMKLMAATVQSLMSEPFLHEPDNRELASDLYSMIDDLKAVLADRITWLDELDAPHFDLYCRNPQAWKRTYSKPETPERFPIAPV